MSYNYYFCSVPKEKLEEYKNISDEGDKIEIFSENEIMLLGSIPEISLINDFEKNCEVILKTSDDIIILVDKYGLIKVFEFLENDLAKMYSELENSPERAYKRIKSMAFWWKEKAMVDKREDINLLSCNAGYYEFELFNLAHILKTYDFEKNHIIFMGW